ncbi:Ig-like domain-containing protein [Streptomyces avermitilis]|uniref:Ig-like domain-containing protein n=1 Tax=Streptomyces avermitilis TaxID=33903 RepID=UPI00368B4E8B
MRSTGGESHANSEGRAPHCGGYREGNGGNILSEVSVDSSGHAQYTTTFATTGTHTITAAYNGNANCFASNSMTTVQVSAAPVPPAPPGHGLCRDDCCGLINIHRIPFVDTPGFSRGEETKLLRSRATGWNAARADPSALTRRFDHHMWPR